MLKRRVRRQIERGRPQRLITLTWRASRPETPEEAAKLLKDAFRNLLRAYRYRHPNAEIEYMVVIERTKRGYPHLHVLLRGPFVSQDWISHYMEQAIDAPIVDVRKIANAKEASRYVSKYLTKDNEKLPGCQRYWKSRGWLLPEDKPDSPRFFPLGGKWRVAKADLITLAQRYSRMGYVIELEDGGLIATPRMLYEGPLPGGPGGINSPTVREVRLWSLQAQLGLG